MNHADGSNFAALNDIPVFVECSAKSNENVDTLFNKIALECYNRRDQFELKERKTFRLGTVVRKADEVENTKK